MRRVRKQRGVTLIEVLIAVSLVSVLAAGILVAIRVGLSALNKANSRLMSNRRIAGAHRILEQQIASFMPIVALYPPAPGAPPGVKMPFFQGEPQAMRFVSTYSLQEAARGYPRILEFAVIPNDQGPGVRLVVNEILYTGPVSAGFFCLGRGPDPFSGVDMPRFRPITVVPGSFVLADRLASCVFSFLEDVQPGITRWAPVFTSRYWPRAVRIEMASADPDPAHLHPVTIAAPIRVNRYPIFQYVDQ